MNDFPAKHLAERRDACQRGFFRDEGFDIELIRMNANISVTAPRTRVAISEAADSNLLREAHKESGINR